RGLSGVYQRSPYLMHTKVGGADHEVEQKSRHRDDKQSNADGDALSHESIVARRNGCSLRRNIQRWAGQVVRQNFLLLKAPESAPHITSDRPDRYPSRGRREISY